MTAKRFWMIIAILIIISVIFYFVVINIKPKAASVVEKVATTKQEQTTAPIVSGTDINVNDKFRAEVPKDIKVPEVNEKLTVEQAKVVAVPTVVTPAAPGVTQQYRSFSIQADGGVYTPSSIIGNINDTIHINITAVDKDYDIVFPSYNMKGVVKKGQTKVMQFQASQEGSFTFYCEMCGGENSTTKGTIIIKK